jgi:hypothetical protein
VGGTARGTGSVRRRDVSFGDDSATDFATGVDRRSGPLPVTRLRHQLMKPMNHEPL